MSVHVVREKHARNGWHRELYNPTRGYAVRCSTCNWRGYRRGLDCECYDENAWYCRPWSPGPGCPSGILYRCPRCAWPNDVVRMPTRGQVTYERWHERESGTTPHSWWWFWKKGM